MTTSTGTQDRRKELFGQGLKECADCRAVMALSEFSPVARNVGRGFSHYASACRPCRQIRNKKYRAENREHVKKLSRLSHVARTYGLSAEKYNAMHAEQRGCCAICMRHATEIKKGLSVDHDHDTGAVRGLLCAECNTAIGMLGDDPATLTAAIAYLQKAKAT